MNTTRSILGTVVSLALAACGRTVGPPASPAADSATDASALSVQTYSSSATGMVEAARGDLREVLVTGLMRVLTARGADEEHCEAFAQEAFLRVRERLDGFLGKSRFTTWALSIATRIAFDDLRHKRLRDVSFDAMLDRARSPLVFERRVEATQERCASASCAHSRTSSRGS